MLSMLENFLGQTDPVNVHAHTHDPEQMEPSQRESITRFREIHPSFCHVPIVHFACRFTLGVGGKRASRRCEKMREETRRHGMPICRQTGRLAGYNPTMKI